MWTKFMEAISVSKCHLQCLFRCYVAETPQLRDNLFGGSSPADGWWVPCQGGNCPQGGLSLERKKRNRSSNYTQHRSVLQTDKACNYSAIPNKEPAFRLMSTLWWHLMWNASHKKDIYLSKDGSIYINTKFLLLEKNNIKRIQGLFVGCWRVEMQHSVHCSIAGDGWSWK